MAKSCPHLKSINLSDCIETTDEAITALIGNCKKLEFLNLSNCKKLTEATTAVLKNHCEHFNDVRPNSKQKIGVVFDHGGVHIQPVKSDRGQEF